MFELFSSFPGYLIQTPWSMHSVLAPYWWDGTTPCFDTQLRDDTIVNAKNVDLFEIPYRRADDGSSTDIEENG